MQLLTNYIDYKSFTPHVLLNTMGSDENQKPLNESAAISFIRNSCINFCEKTGILKREVKVDLQCGLSDYILELPSCETIFGVKKAKFKNFESSFSCDERFKSWEWGDVSFKFNDDVLSISPAPTEDSPQGLIVEVFVAPSRNSCEVDEQLHSKWFDAVVHGALSEIHLIPNYPWSSTSRADYRRRLFNEEVSRAIVRKVDQAEDTPLKFMPNPDWMSRSFRRRW